MVQLTEHNPAKSLVGILLQPVLFMYKGYTISENIYLCTVELCSKLEKSNISKSDYVSECFCGSVCASNTMLMIFKSNYFNENIL